MWNLRLELRLSDSGTVVLLVRRGSGSRDDDNAGSRRLCFQIADEPRIRMMVMTMLLMMMMMMMMVWCERGNHQSLKISVAGWIVVQCRGISAPLLMISWQPKGVSRKDVLGWTAAWVLVASGRITSFGP